MYAFWLAQTVPREQPADDGAVGSQRVNREHDASMNQSSLHSLPEGWADVGVQLSGSFLLLKHLQSM